MRTELLGTVAPETASSTISRTPEDDSRDEPSHSNAITPLLYFSHLTKHRELLQLTEAAAARIDWVLREVLPRDEVAPAADHELRKLIDVDGPGQPNQRL